MMPRTDHQSRGPRAGLLVVLVFVATSLVAGCGAILGGLGGGPTVTVPGGIPPDLERRLLGPWQAVPIALDGAIVETAEAGCAQAGAFAADEGRGLAVVEARGEGQLTLLYRTDDGYETCHLTVQRGGRLQVGAAGAMVGDRLGEIEGEALEIVGSGSTGGHPAAWSSVQGRVGPDVASVRVLVDGRTIEASTGGGWFMASWPSDTQSFVVEAYGADGAKLGEASW